MIFTEAMIEKGLRSYHRDAGGKPPRKGGKERRRQAAAITNVLLAIEDDLRVAFLLEAAEKAKPRLSVINGGRQ